MREHPGAPVSGGVPCRRNIAEDKAYPEDPGNGNYLFLRLGRIFHINSPLIVYTIER
jgi:hypothetical protein